MDIKNFTQFVNLLVLKHIVHVHPAFDKLATCLMVYNGMCACGGNTNKNKSDKSAECNRIYRESLSVVDSMKSHLFVGCADNTISFYIDNVHHVKTISR